MYAKAWGEQQVRLMLAGSGTDYTETVRAAVPNSRIDRGPERDEADARDYRTSFARLATAFPDACTTRLSQGVREIADAMDAKELGDPDLPEYDNFRGLTASRNAGRITAVRSLACERLHAEYAAADWSTQ
ncbi:hypothetical protein ACQP1K_29080 (plasmid) [Sphaerimonospora sp. CA-214678]|uniref:hypothetical protein n=1 Tax=Sphaerimonospora sp. CA-214678 TaxID=3240029 RepID=UPI003D8FF56B